MKLNLPNPILIAFGGVLIIVFLVSCNMPGRRVEPSGMDVTQAYQTVQAQLTQAIAQPLIETATQTPTLLLNETATQTPVVSPTAGSANPTDTPSSQKRCDQAAAAYPKIDITIPDDTELDPGEEFAKVWRVVNVGTCTWTANYDIVFFSGELMGAPVSQPLNFTVPPNQSVDLAVDMVAPNKAGSYQGNWKLRNADGVLFGIGPIGESPFWVRIKVVSIATETPTSTPSLTPTTAVQASGSVTLAISDTLNLDNLQVNVSGADLEFILSETDPPQHLLVPVGSVIVGVYGGIQPSMGDCQGANMSGSVIILEDLTIGSYLCYRTDLSLPGWLRLDGFDPEAKTVTLQVFTWKLP